MASLGWKVVDCMLKYGLLFLYIFWGAGEGAGKSCSKFRARNASKVDAVAILQGVPKVDVAP